MCWNAVLNIFDFFSHEMPGYEPATVYPFAANGLIILSNILLIIYGNRYSDRVKIQFGFIIIAILMMFVPFLAHYITSPSGAFYAVFINLMLFGLVQGMVIGSVFGSAAILPPNYMGIVMFGNGISGIFMGVLRAILEAIIPGDDKLFT